MMLVIFFSPLQISSIPAQNAGIVKDLLNYICIYTFLLPSTQQPSMILQALLSGLTMYTDPTSWPMILGFLLCDTKKQSTMIQILLCIGVTFGLMLITACYSPYSKQYENMKNILLLKEHHPTIGLYFYISIEIFKLHVNYFLYAYLIFTLIIIIQVQSIVRRAYAVVALCTQHDFERYERRVFRIKCICVFLVVFCKVFFNQYPLLIDLQMIVFTLVCCNMRTAIKKIEGRLVLTFVLIFAIICSMILFNTWLDRFSGNANFFYFQTIVYNLILVVVFIQMFQALS